MDGGEFKGEMPMGALRGAPSRGAPTRDGLRDLVMAYGHLLGDGASQIVPGEGNPAADVVLVGEAPGEEEDRAGRPFVGRSGKLLDQILATAGVERRDLWITNTVKSRPVSMESGRARNRAPLTSEVKAWRPCLEAELALIRPQLIIGLGAVAGRALVTPDFKITRQRGQFFDNDDLGVSVIVTWHPSYILRQVGDDYRARLGEAIADVQKAFRRLGALRQDG